MRPYNKSEVRRGRNGGYALLTVIFFAAALFVTLAAVMPRVAMNAQRVREETLIYRGEQYKRAVELYFRKFQKYPQSLDDLEDTNGIRFLRRRYRDPITGEDEWRLVKMGANGRFENSLIRDLEEGQDTGFGVPAASLSSQQQNRGLGAGDPQQPQPGASGVVVPQYGAAQQGQVSPQAQQGFQTADGRLHGAARALARRQSAAPERIGRGELAPQPGLAGPQQAGGPDNPDDPNADPNQAGAQQPDYSRMLPSQVPAGVGMRRPVPGQQRAQQGRPSRLGANPPGNGRGFVGQANAPQAAAGQPAGGAGFAPGQRAAGGFGGAAASGQAADIIRGILTTPRPGGLQGVRQQQAGAQQSNFQGGIAGVASKAEEFGVKIYEGRQFYNEWEFVYDYREDSVFGGPSVGPQRGGNAVPGSQPGLTGAETIGVTPDQTAPAGVAPPPGYPTGGATGGQPDPPLVGEPPQPPGPGSPQPGQEPRPPGPEGIPGIPGSGVQPGNQDPSGNPRQPQSGAPGPEGPLPGILGLPGMNPRQPDANQQQQQPERPRGMRRSGEPIYPPNPPQQNERP